MNIPQQPYDATTIATLRQALDEVMSDHRFRGNRFVTALEMAECILKQAAMGERDIARLKQRAFEKLAA
jgi:hypothetical protein